MSTSDGEQRFSLRWNEYQSALASAFELLRINEDFVDVTLGCEGKRLPSHRMLLSACSPYFRDLLKSNPCQHPIIIMRETKYEDLKSILEFMYQGEVSVEQSKLDSFLRTAESLRIRGLTEQNEDLVDQKPDISGTSNHLGDMAANDMFKQEKRKSTNSLMGREMPKLSSLGGRPTAEPGSSGRKRMKTDKIFASAQSGIVGDQAAYKTEKMEEVINLDDEQEQELLTSRMEGCEEEYGADESELYDEEFDNVVDGSSLQEDFGDDGGLTGFDFVHCGVAFGSHEAWKIHIDQCHPDDFTCLHCPKVFRLKQSLINHTAVHEGRTKCTICHKTLSDVRALKRHLRLLHNIQQSSRNIMPSVP